jgi:hypothetical protein
MRTLLSAILAYVSAFVISRHQLAMEVVALRQQLAVYKRKQPHPKLRRSERLFWVVVRQMWDYCLGLSSSLNLIPSSLGIGPATGCSGDGAHARSESGGQEWPKKSDS